MAKKFIVREGFVVLLTLPVPGKPKETYERRHEAGEVIELDDDQAALHLHKLELADPKAREKALAAEQAAAASKVTQSDPATFATLLADAIRQAMAVPQQVAPQQVAPQA